jgi:hypothetical protein
MLNAYIVNEKSILPLLLRGLFKRPTCVIAVDAQFPPLQRLLENFANLMVQHDLTKWAVDYAPSCRSVWEYPTRTFLYDVFGLTEDWQDRYFAFDEIDARAPDYQLAYKHTTCGYLKPKHVHILLMSMILDDLETSGVVLRGVPHDIFGLLNAYRGNSKSTPGRSPHSPRRWLNLFLVPLVLAYSIAAVIRRIRIFPPPVKSYYLAADYIEDKRDIPLYQSFAEAGPVLLSVRWSKRRLSDIPKLNGMDFCDPKSGCFSIRQGFLSLGMVIADVCKLTLKNINLPFPHFYRVIALPYRRAIMRAFFNRYHPKYFWSRDDYNTEHIFRSEELRRIGAKSFGLSHGFPISANLYATIRYIDFDHYFVNGIEPFDRFFKARWPRHMVIEAAGTFGASSDEYDMIEENRNNDIVVFNGFNVGEPAMVEFVRGLAEAFPDRQVLLQIKTALLNSPTAQKYILDCCANLANVVHVTDPVSLLFRKARYAFSDPSTVIPEALQLGLFVFFADVLPYQRTCILRNFPFLCVDGAGSAVMRIRSIEDGSARYQREDFANLTNLSGRTFIDIVRNKTNLVPIAAPRRRYWDELHPKNN